MGHVIPLHHLPDRVRDKFRKGGIKVEKYEVKSEKRVSKIEVVRPSASGGLCLGDSK